MKTRTNPFTKLAALSLLLPAMAILTPCPLARGATYTWDPGLTPATPSGGTGTWDANTTANWSNGSIDNQWANTGNDVASISGAAGTITLSGSLNALGLQFLTTGYTLTGGTLTLGASGIDASALTSGTTTISSNLTLNPGFQQWKIGSGGTLAINGTVTPNRGATVSVSGNGVTSSSLSNTNGIIGAWITTGTGLDWATMTSGTIGTYSGYTTIAAATAPVATTNYRTTGGASISSSGTINSVKVDGGDFGVGANTLTIASGGIILGSTERWFTGTTGTINSGLSTGELYIHANTAAFSNGFQIQPIIVDTTGTTTAVIKDGPGQTELGNGGSTFSGGVYLNAGKIYMGASSTGGNGSAVTSGPLGTGTVTFNGGTLVLGGKNNGTSTSAGQTEGNNLIVPNGISAVIDGYGGNGGLNGNLSGGGTLTLQNTSATGLSFNIGGSVDWSGFTGTLNYNPAGSVLNIQGGSGNLDLSHASVVINNASQASSSWRTGGTFTTKFGALSSTGAQAQIQLQNTSTLEVGNLALSTTFGGVISNTGNLKIVGGTLTLSNNNTYTGATTISSGTLRLSNTNAVSNSVVSIGVANGLAFNNTASGGSTYNTGGLSGSGNEALADVSGSNVTLNVGNNNNTGMSYSGALSGSGSLTKVGTGTQILSGADTYSGGTTISAGMLQFGGTNSMPASGTVSVASGATLAVNAGGAGEFTGGTSGAGTIGGLLSGTGGQGAPVSFAAGSSLGIDTTNGNVSFAGNFTATSGSVGLLKIGAGELQLTGGGTFGGNGAGGFPLIARSGTLRMNGGLYTVNGEGVVGGTFGTAAGAAGLNASLVVDSGTMAVSGFLSVGRGNGTGGVSSDLVLNNNAVVTAANFSGGYNAASALNKPKGTVTLNGTSSLAITGNGVFNGAESAGSDITITVNDSSVLSGTGTGFKAIGMDGAKGTLNINNSGYVNFGNAVTYIGYKSGTGTLNLTSGTFNNAGEVQVAGADVNGVWTGGTGAFNISGGVATVGALTVARGNSNTATFNGTVTVTSGTLNSLGDVILGYAGAGDLGKMVINGGTVNVGPTAGRWVMVGNYDTAKGELDISSGSLNLMNGTSIKMNRQAGTGANVINQTGGNVNFYSDAGSTFGGGGDLDMQYIGAAASSNTYNLDGGTLTVPQIDSTATSGTRTFNFNGGTLKAAKTNATFMNLGAGNARANVRNGGALINTNGFNVTVAQALLHSNIGGDNATDGGLTKSGNGTLTLTGSSTYTGTTSVIGGTLEVGVAGSINSSALITVNGSTAKLLQSNTSTAISPAITLTQGTLDGTGAVGAVTVGAGTGGIVTNGNGTTSQLTIGSLTFSGAGTISLNKVDDTSTAAVVVTGALTTNSGVTLNVATPPTWINGSTYNMISYGSLSGSNPVKGTITGLGARQSATVGNTGTSAGFITLVIAGDTPYWTGSASNAWTTATIPSPKNWKLVTAGTPTDFLFNDQVLFDDNATGSTSVDITGSNAGVASVVFNNNTKNYTIGSSGGFGIADGSGPATLTKSGTGTVTLTSSNTYTGATTINNGTLQIGDGTTDGSIGTTSNIVDNGTLVYNRLGSFTNGSVISGTGVVVKSGTGTQILTATNTYSGGTTINNGTLQLTTVGPEGATVNNGTYTLNGGTFQINQSVANFHYNATINVNANSTFSSIGAGQINYNGVLTGSSNVLNVNTGASRLYMNGTVSGISQFNVTSGAMGFDLNAGNQGGSAPVVVANGASLYFANATNPLSNNITLNGGTGQGGVGALFQEGGGAPTLSGNVTFNGDTTIGGNNASGNVALSNGISGTGSLTKAGVNTYTLLSTGSYTGSTIISAGTLQLGNGGTAGSLLTSSTISIASTATLAVNRSNPVTQGVDFGVITGTTGILTQAGSGTLTLSGSNSITTLNVNNATGTVDIGSGNLTLYNGGSTTIHSNTGGTINATGGGKIVLAQLSTTDGPDIGTANGTTLTINASITGTSAYENWTGTNNGTGVTVLTAANDYTGDTIVHGGVLSVSNIGNQGSITSNLGQGTTIHFGTGTVSTGTLLYTGTGETSNRVIDLQGTTAGGIVDASGSGLLKFTSNNTETGAGAKTLTLQGSGLGEFAGSLSGTNGALAVTKAGTGTWTLSGSNSYTGQTTVNAGTLNYSGTLSSAAQINVGVSGGANAVMNVQAGASITMSGNSNILVGNGVGGAGQGFIYQTGGSIAQGTYNQLQLGAANGTSYGYYNMSGGTSSFSEADIGGFNGTSTGVLDMSSGTMTVGVGGTNGWLIANRTGGSGGIGILNLTGGTLTYTGPAGQFQNNWGSNGTAIINISNATLSAASADLSLNQDNNATNFGEINLLTGGTLQVHTITSSANGTKYVNFNGGTLKANTATATFITTANTAVNVFGNGGTIDNNGAAITIPVGLLAASGTGVSSVAVTNAGSGYLGAPAVTFSGGSGTGAAGYAVVNSGTISSIVITNPGTGYTSAPTITLTGGGGSGATLDTAILTTNTSGGMTFSGNGTTTLTNVNTYTGGTIVTGGTVDLAHPNPTNAGTGAIRGTLTVNSGATVLTSQQNALGYTAGIETTAVNINGGTLNNTSTGDQGYSTTFNLTGGTMTSNGGVSSGTTGSLFVLGKQSGGADAVNTFASSTTSTIAGRVNLAGENSNSNVTFTVADGAAATDLLVSAAITERNGPVGIIKAGAGTMTLTGSNTYTGATNVNNGTLNVNNALASTTISVASPATLNVGSTAATGTATSMTVDGQANFSGTDASIFAVGSLTVDASGTTTLTAHNGGASGVKVLDLSALSIATSFDLAGNAAGGGQGESELISAAPVPEPNTWAMLLAGLVTLAVFQRRRQHTNSSIE